MWTALHFDLMINLFVAATCGAVLGLERELQRKPSGLRTNMLIALGSAIFTYSSIAIAKDGGDPGRIAAQIVTGIGFLGAGNIIRQGNDWVAGLTSAATVWVVAAVGVFAGAGESIMAFMSTIMALVILAVLNRMEGMVYRKFVKIRLIMETDDREGVQTHLENSLRSHGLENEKLKIRKTPEGGLKIYLYYLTTRSRHDRFLKDMTRADGIRCVESKVL